MASDCVSPAESARPDAAAERAPLFRRPRSVAAVPMVFLGLGLYRAWIEIVFVGTFVAFPAATVSARDLFDWTMVATALGCTLLARRIGPFFDKRWPFVLGSAMLVASTTLMFASCWVASLAAWAGYAAAVAGGFGIALVILTWSELYGCLNPLRVALYYSASIVAGAVVLYAYRGFMLPWLFVMTALLPPLSFWAASRGFAHLPPQERPATAWTRFSVPWKAVLFMAAYAFGYGLMENGMYGGVFGPHSAPGAVLVAVLVFVGISFQGGRFDFSLIYRFALPLIVAALFLVPVFGGTQNYAAGFCMAAAYTAQSILIMLICANICYRYGVSAIWLFGIERGVRQIFMWLGRVTAAGVGALESFGIGGEVAVSVMLEAITRLLPGFMGNPDSIVEESYTGGNALLEHHQYTKPATWRGIAVPPILTSGDHGKVDRFRRDEALTRTNDIRPDLIEQLDCRQLDKQDRKTLIALGWEVSGARPRKLQ